MVQEEIILWEKIKDFQFDSPHAQFTFSQRLARENGWHRNYTQRVIEEYKRFIFLCCVGKTSITPSDAVDQVWHLHLTYTQSYWIDLCQNTLERQIHHNPTQGGNSERKKFKNQYKTTFEVYKQYFGHFPPEDIWLNEKTRFSEINFRRVNMHRYWLIPKPAERIKILTGLFFILFLGLSFIQANEFTIIWILGILAFILFVLSIMNSNNKPGNNNNTDSNSGYNNSDTNHYPEDNGCGSGCSGCGGCSG